MVPTTFPFITYLNRYKMVPYHLVQNIFENVFTLKNKNLEKGKCLIKYHKGGFKGSEVTSKISPQQI